MCGFAGFVGSSDGFKIEAALAAMGEAIAHRGPDDTGIWRSHSGLVNLVHRRLSILDLSASGHQPMTSPSDRYVIALNGEIYNHLVLRAELEREKPHIKWRGHSDTETLLCAIDCWGLEKTLQKSVGMFAFALWDSESRNITLCRDRVGEKPLYYGWHKGTFLFGSELGALQAHPAFVKRIDKDVLALYLRHFYVPAPHCIWENIYKLMPGSYSVFTEQGRELHSCKYWSPQSAIEDSKQNAFEGSAEQAVTDLGALLEQSVKQQMLADVPLGGFLSGGVDSSAIVALMQKNSMQPVNTFAIGFHEQKFNEANYAKAVAEHLGTNHTELYIGGEDALELIPRIPEIYDEPFADASQLPTRLVMQLAKNKVTVALSGDGGDELFGGYSRYAQAQRIWNVLPRIPCCMRGLFSLCIGRLPSGAVNMVGRRVLGNTPNFYDKLLKARKLLLSRTESEMYHSMVSLWQDPTQVVLGANEKLSSFTDPARGFALDNFFEEMMARDLDSYLPDDILTKVDRASMSVSLEARVPLLDHRVIEYAWRLPLGYKVRDGHSKWALRQVLYQHVPASLIERPKKGFSVPMEDWLRGPLNPLLKSLLAPERLRGQGVLDAEVVRRLITEHESGLRNWSERLWALVVFQLWHEQNMAC